MKIIIRDVSDRDNPYDALFCDHIEFYHGVTVMQLLNAYYRIKNKLFKLVEDDYKLQEATEVSSTTL